LGEAQALKDKLKKVKGLPLDQEFIPDTSHNCPFCPRKFDKPCSLGGHISKVHYKESRKLKQETISKNLSSRKQMMDD
jgi:hypothetical protein